MHSKYTMDILSVVDVVDASLLRSLLAWSGDGGMREAIEVRPPPSGGARVKREG